MGNLHGGMTATLVDMLTTLVTFTSPPHKLGVSVDMSIRYYIILIYILTPFAHVVIFHYGNFFLHGSYLRPVPVGEDVTINAEVIKMGRTLVFTGAELLNKDGKLVAKASHTKFIGEGQPTPFTEKKESWHIFWTFLNSSNNNSLEGQPIPLTEKQESWHLFLNILEFFKQYHPRTSFLVSPSWKFKYIWVPFPPFNLSDEYLLDILYINELPPRF